MLNKMNDGWVVDEVKYTDKWGDYQIKHISPIDDIRPHILSMSCWCKPRWDKKGGLVGVHNSLDKREKYQHSRLQDEI